MEGWTWLLNARKWHYFVNRRSLCGKWAILFGGDLDEIGSLDGENCKVCQRKLEERKSKDE